MRTRSQSRKNKRQDARLWLNCECECCICFETFEHCSTTEIMPDNVACCENNHTVCFECLQHIVCGVRKRGPVSCIFAFRCPLCREINELDLFNLYSILKRDRATAIETFKSEAPARIMFRRSP